MNAPPQDGAEYTEVESVLKGEHRLVSSKGVQELGLNTLLALYADLPPSIFSDQDRKYKPHFQVRASAQGTSF